MLAKTLIDKHYRDPAKLAHAIADALAEQVRQLDADIVQIDEANLPGHPEEWEWAAAAINRVLDAVPGDAGRASVLRQLRRPDVQKGTWDSLIATSTRCTPTTWCSSARTGRRGDRRSSATLKPEIGFGLGVIDIKANEVEIGGRRSRAPSSVPRGLGAGRVKYIHPDCGFWMLKRPIADAKIRALARGRDLFEGRAHAH